MNHFFKLLDQSPKERCLSPSSNEIESPRLDTLGAKAKKFFSKMNMFTKVREFRDTISDMSTDTCSKTKKSPSRKLRNEIEVSRNWSSDVFQDNIFSSTSYHSAISKSYDCTDRSWQIETENHNPPKSVGTYQTDTNLPWSMTEKEFDSTSSFLSLEEFNPTKENLREMLTDSDQPRVKKISLKPCEQESESDVSFKSLKTSFIKEFKDEVEERSKISHEDVDLSFISLENFIPDGNDNTKNNTREGNEYSIGKDNFEVLDMDLTLNILNSPVFMNPVEACENEMKTKDNDNAVNVELSVPFSKLCDSKNISENLSTLTSMDELNLLDVGILMNDSSERIEDTDADIKEDCITDNVMHEISVQKPGTTLLDNEDYPEVKESSNQMLNDNNVENIQEMEISLKESLIVENLSQNGSSFFEYLNVSNIESPANKYLLETDEIIHTGKNNKTPSYKKFQKTSSPKSISNDSGYQNHSSALSTERSSLSVLACDSRDVSYEPKIMKDLANTSDLYLTAMEDSTKNDSNDCLIVKSFDLLKQ